MKTDPFQSCGHKVFRGEPTGAALSPGWHVHLHGRGGLGVSWSTWSQNDHLWGFHTFLLTLLWTCPYMSISPWVCGIESKSFFLQESGHVEQDCAYCPCRNWRPHTTLLGFVLDTSCCRHNHTIWESVWCCLRSPPYLTRIPPSPSRLCCFWLHCIAAISQGSSACIITNLNPADSIALPFILIPWGKNGVCSKINSFTCAEIPLSLPFPQDLVPIIVPISFLFN